MRNFVKYLILTLSMPIVSSGPVSCFSFNEERQKNIDEEILNKNLVFDINELQTQQKNKF